MERMNKSIVSAKYDQEFESREWQSKIPKLKFHSSWDVKIIPPFGGAIIRFVIYKNDKSCSIYFDGYGLLGAVDVPYWEIYPVGEDTYRCMLNDVDELLFVISCAINGLDVSSDVFGQAPWIWAKENDVDINTDEGQMAFKLRWL